MTCVECRFFVLVAAAERGECRRSPPQQMLVQDSKAIVVGFPFVHFHDWCGEFQAADGGAGGRKTGKRIAEGRRP